MSSTAKVKIISEVKDVSSHTLLKSSDTSRTYAGTGDIDVTLTSSSTPDFENGAVFTKSLSGGAATIDLTSLTHADGDTRSADGKKLRFLQVMNPAANTGNIVLTKGASNGHSPIGSTFTVPVSPGGAFLWYFDSDGATVANGSSDTIDVTGTGSESFYVKMGWG